ncbi:MAG: M23 family metallopeptidase [Actinomycetota bacterium]
MADKNRHMVRIALAVASGLVALAGPTLSEPAFSPEMPNPRGSAATAPWRWPLEPTPAVAAPFRAPPTPWSAGHRGVDLVGSSGQAVRAAALGRIGFSGRIAHRGVITVIHETGLRTTYEPVDHRLPVGTNVRPGEKIGILASNPSHCAPQICLHWGLRRGDQYFNPLFMLTLGPPVLLPLD